jgi:prepilin-type N-terminal cleavage/methylation domain-containing protein
MKKGFTLIELLVVIAIIGMLAGIVLVSLGGARSKARDAKRQSDIRQITSAQEMYYGDKEAYLTHAACTSDAAGCLPPIGTYIGELDDPQNTGTQVYHWLDNTTCSPAGQAYCAYAILENKGSCGTTRYFAASEKGTKEICDTAPTNGCACW